MTWLDGSWDRVSIDGIVLPGRVLKLDIKPKRKVEKTKPQGTDNPFTKDQGYEGAEVNLEIELFKAEQATQLGELLAALSPRQPGAVSSPHVLGHPIAVAANVTKVYVEEYTIGMPIKNRLKVPIKMSEWFPPEPPKKTNQSNKSGAAGSSAVKGGNAMGSGGPFDSGYVPPPDPANKGASFV